MRKLDALEGTGLRTALSVLLHLPDNLPQQTAEKEVLFAFNVPNLGIVGTQD